VDEWVNVCIPPGGSTIVSSTIPADVPVMARAYTGCPPDPFAESYTGNPAFGCTPPPDTVPYLLTWYDPMDGEHWGVTVE
jgi:hypothetical protein